MNDISNLISVLRTESVFHDKEVAKLFSEALRQLNLDLIKGEYNATPPTVDAVENLMDHIATREANRAAIKKSVQDKRGLKVAITEDDEDS